MSHLAIVLPAFCAASFDQFVDYYGPEDGERRWDAAIEAQPAPQPAAELPDSLSGS